MTVAYDVVAFYAALVLWSALLVWGFRRNDHRLFFGFGLALLLFLNLRYFVEGPPGAIAFFIGIYDVFDNIGLGQGETAPALATCAENACTVWGDRYANHPSWGVAFYERFASGPTLRTNLLRAHIGFNTVAFILMHVQLLGPAAMKRRSTHKIVGRISFAAITAGTFCAVWLASEHGAVPEYGGFAAELGFYSMSAFVYGTVLIALRAIRRGEAAEHRKWMIRWAGSMWGAFWLFRVLLVVTGPLLRNYESASLLISIWLSAPLGIAIAEYLRLRMARRRTSVVKKTTLPAMVGAR